MRILIDGYNLIRRVPELADLDREDLAAGRKELLRRLSAYRAGSGHRITVVFDGTGAASAGRRRQTIVGIDVIFSARGETADAVLAEMSAAGSSDVLVTADRLVASAAPSRSITTADPFGFWAKVVEDEMYRQKGADEKDEEETAPHPKGRKPSKRRRKDMKRLSRL